MKMLIVGPPYIPLYFNQCHNVAQLWEIVGYIRKAGNAMVKGLDGGVLNKSWSEIIKELATVYDLVAILNTFENVDAVERLAHYCRKISPATRILTYGEVTSWIPTSFMKLGVDAIVDGGDWEATIEDYAKFIQGELSINELRGLFVKTNGRWSHTEEGRFLDPSEWGFPPLKDMPLADYFRLGENEGLKKAGIAGNRELSVTVSRGCTMGCPWCSVSRIQGRKDRRRKVQTVLEFIEESLSAYRFDYVSIYSPNFVADKEYVVNFCEEIKRRDLCFKWKCVATISHTDRELIRLMAQSGCFRIGFGVETLERTAQKNLKKIIDEKRLEKTIEWCHQNNVQPLCFLMIGIPGQTKEGVKRTIDRIREMGGAIRVTAFTPYQQLTGNMSLQEIKQFNKQTMNNNSIKGLDDKDLYKYVFDIQQQESKDEFV